MNSEFIRENGLGSWVLIIVTKSVLCGTRRAVLIFPDDLIKGESGAEAAVSNYRRQKHLRPPHPNSGLQQLGRSPSSTHSV